MARSIADLETSTIRVIVATCEHDGCFSRKLPDPHTTKDIDELYREALEHTREKRHQVDVASQVTAHLTYVPSGPAEVRVYPSGHRL